VSKIGVQNWCPKSSKKVQKIVQKIVRKIIIKKLQIVGGVGWGGEGGWRIVIPMPEALNCVEGRRQKVNSQF
jgi:hypothetical protein